MTQIGSSTGPDGHERVHVAVRVRPFVETDPENAQLTSITLDDTHLAVGEKRVFRVDRVFGMTDETETLYEEMVRPLVASFLEGFSATVMAYGQTGSGKTFTMTGLIPDVVSQLILDGGAGRADDFSFECLEVYGDTIRDLFSTNPEASAASVRLYEGPAEDLVIAADRTVQLASASVRQANQRRYSHDGRGGGGVQVVGARRLKARSLSEVLQLVDSGAAVRATAATHMNQHSSRSHSIFTIFHERKGCKLHLVDLAGSERNKKTLNVGQRFQESIAINTGLFALGNVIRALARRSSALTAGASETEPGMWPSTSTASHIPYRSGKLTRLLQDALGGHSKTLFIACVAPDDTNQDETIRTAQYCSLAMKVLNAPIRQYEQLRQRQSAKGGRPSSSSLNARPGEAAAPSAELIVADEQRDQLLQEIELLRDELQCTYEHVDACEEELAKDASTFEEQIAAVTSLLHENQQLKERVRALESAPRVVATHTASCSPASPSPGPVPTVALSPSPLDAVLSAPRKSSSSPAAGQCEPGRSLGDTTSSGRLPELARSVPRWSSPTPQAASIRDSLSASLARPARASSATWTGGVVHHEESAAPDELLQLQRHRDEQMMQLAHEALQYQLHNSELRSKLSAMVTLLETQKRESALLRLELDATKDAFARLKHSTTK